MRLVNLRLGHACNSSSSHSLIKYRHQDGRDAYGYDEPWWGTIKDGDSKWVYGWEEFTIGSLANKMRYFYLQLRHIISDELDFEWADHLLNLIGEVPDEATIDHQSLWQVPLDRRTMKRSREFVDWLYHFMQDTNTVILGGNDNDSHDHPLAKYSYPLELEYGYVRFDGPFVTLFNRGNGTRVTLTMDSVDAEKDGIEVRFQKPLLVDLKITDYCPFGCKYCYQNSTVHGQHADLTEIAELIRDLEVFEVAIGGGEPTLHPQFLEILEAINELGVNANFTTRNLKWLEDMKYAEKVFELIGAVAFSVDSIIGLRSLQLLLGDIPNKWLWHGKVTIQIPMGTVNQETFNMILDEGGSDFTYTLLGYKTDGRGSEFKPKNYDWWWDAVKNRNLNIQIDTAMAKQYAELLITKKISHALYHAEEGQYSLYVDAVNGTFGQASYGCETYPFEHAYDILDEFRTWEFK